MPKRHAKAEPSQHTPPKVDNIVLVSSESDDDSSPVHIISSDSDSDDEFPVFHPDGRLEQGRGSAKERKIEKQEPTGQEATAGTNASPTAQLPTVDPLCAIHLVAPTIYGNHGVIYNVVLNQTCIKMNRNKFYNMQLVKDVYDDHYYVWFRWGRVGEKGLTNLVPCENDILKAQLLFEEKFYLKTGNKWEVWANDMKFEKQKGKYDMLKVDYSGPENQGDSIEKLSRDIASNAASSRLEPNLMKLMSLISDVKAMKENVVSMHFNVEKVPLGRLTKEQILAGYKALHKIEDCINKDSPKSELTEACSEFYTCIPHSFSRRQRPMLICTNEQVQEKLKLLEALEDVHTTLELYRKKIEIESQHPLDRLYRTLDCGLTELDCTNNDYKIIQASLEKTHGSTHIGYPVPVNGYMFGKGVYFADCVSKSANYCFRTLKQEGLLLLCEVSLGKIKEEAHAKSYNILPKGVNSIMGVGQFTPESVGDFPMSNGVMMACGKLVKRPRSNLSLLYNEYIVYNTNQVKMVYLVKN
ncbi:hypothetical protein MTO96_011758 [Rhipicephalus appendiculatus]